MSDQGPKESFANLFAAQAQAKEKKPSLRVGEVLRAPIVQIGKDIAFVELDQKRQAFIELIELRSPDGQLAYKVGDIVEARIVEIDRSGEVRLGRSMGKPESLAALEQARDTGVPVEGKVTGLNKGGLEVEIGGARAFCPFSQVDVRFVQDPSVFLGQSLRFRVTEIRDGKNVVLSRRAVLEEEGRGARDRLLATLRPGAIVDGTVSSIRDFGAFVDLGGIEGLIPMSELSHERGIAAADVLSPGQRVQVQVRDIKESVPDPTKKAKRGDPGFKITLSLKALAQDPWDDVERVAPLGKVIVGTVSRTADFGVFIRLAPGIDGLLHVSEMSGKSDPHRAFTTGQALRVVVDRVDRAAKKIGLVPAPDGLEAGAAVARQSIGVGTIVTGKVDHIETFGVFVQIDGTKGRVGRGLIPNAELGTARGSDTRKLFPEGTVVKAKVLETGEGKLRLSIKAMKEDEERAEFDGYRESSGTPDKLGTFGDLLKKKLGG